MNSLRKIFLQQSDNFRTEYRSTDALPAVSTSCKPNWRSILYECGLMYHCIHACGDGVDNDVPRQLRIYFSIELLWQNPVKRSSMLIFLRSCINVKYGVKNSWIAKLLKEHGVLVWLGFFSIQKSQGSMTCMAQGVVSKSGRFLPTPTSGFCLLTYVCTTACVPRLCQGKHWPQGKDQRRNKQCRVEMWDSSRESEHVIGSLGCCMQGSYLNVDIWLSNPISIFYTLHA